jgi:hypothetical protein
MFKLLNAFTLDSIGDIAFGCDIGFRYCTHMWPGHVHLANGGHPQELPADATGTAGVTEGLTMRVMDLVKVICA